MLTVVAFDHHYSAFSHYTDVWMSEFSNIVPNFSVLFQIVGMHKEKGNGILVKIFAVGHKKMVITKRFYKK